ncbi:NAD(P)-dependent dehydrogenase (short-subunit alcohol dehydrogenase family) [Hydrogenophaga palleronii]|uniref:NAD(P)-dependent dehydrogenase (Short-subunit alcohol dehydrogenase family) n=1 Tax=Hydrogenophaga palleronii TaxID=65655 RepID=A0ABU1WRF6_9BURK|nr:oxidoreductase [Hydrogenophaga palleronii]MDR7151898.1 NAD(P)-dependent dehydrogenase (short-subunit alcohol dehydrogenase family) [Hydrogenophaga palleronii]
MSSSKVVFVTGVSSGIGRATAAQFAQRGCNVFGSVRDLKKAPAIPGVEFVEMDVRDTASVQRAVNAIIGKAQRIDVLVNNAGGTMLGSVEETSVAEVHALFETNVFGILRTIQAVLPHMRQQRSGRIINVSSVLGFLPAPFMGLYAASKHAVEGLSESLDHEVRNLGIRVVLVEPSYTKTNLDLNAPQAANPIPTYDADRALASEAVVRSVQKAPGPEGVATTIIDAAFGTWAMRRTPKGEASLLRKLRRFMPAGPLDGNLRKTFGLG